MSDCPDCEETGFTLEYSEKYAADGADDGEFYRLRCRNWRHQLDADRAARAAEQGAKP